MSERLLFLTGHLAKPRLAKILREAGLDEASIHDIGVKVAALMTEAIIARRLPRPVSADKIVLPGRVRVDLDKLSAEFGVPFVRGPDELKDLPKYLGRGGAEPDLSQHDLRIFAEIVDASMLGIDAILGRARKMKAAGADVIDIGCLPDTPFPRLEDAVRELKSEGFKVSVDSASADELRRGGKAGADFLLSLTGRTLSLAEETGAMPVLIPEKHGDLETLWPALEEAEKRGIACLADPILDPIHFGFTSSLERYAELRRRAPRCEMLMGTGNLTELTDADSGGITAMLLGISSELAIRNVLTVQVSPHTLRTVEEHDAARRMMFAAKRDESLPRDYSSALLSLHGRAPFPSSPAEIAAAAADVRDRNYRIETSEDGIHVYNSLGHHVAKDALSLFPKLGVERDAPHAFYLATELMKAEVAFALGKRYAQDEPLDWGAAADLRAEDKSRLAEAGHTLRAKEAD